MNFQENVIYLGKITEKSGPFIGKKPCQRIEYDNVSKHRNMHISPDSIIVYIDVMRREEEKMQKRKTLRKLSITKQEEMTKFVDDGE